MASPPNKLGKYEIRKMLGKGAMGIVFLAHDPVLERDVAIKVMAQSAVTDSRKKARFEREAKAVARLHHPNIVTIHDLGYDHEGSPFIAMELLEGGDLEQLVDANPVSVRRRLEIVAQVCRGLHHAHEAGIVHRDIKPANIFVTKDGAKIMDFGVARWMQSSQTQSGVVHGTVNYMSPEQIRGERVDGRSDIYSIGIVLFQLLTDEKLFSGDSIETVFFKTLSDDPPELGMPEGLSLPGLQQLVSSALAKEADDRFSSAEAMANAIERFVQEQSASLPQTPVFRALRPTPKLTRGRERTLRITPVATQRVDRDGAGSVRAKQPVASARPGVSRRAGVSRRSGMLLRLSFALALVGAGLASFVYMPREPMGSPPAETVSEPNPGTADLEQRFQFAQELLESGQIAQAFEAVQNILTIEPANPRALELQEAIRKTAEDQATPPAPASPPVVEPAPPPIPTPSHGERAAAFAADAALAIGSDELEQARSLIAQGQRLDPDNPRWSKLLNQLGAKQAQADARASVERHVQEGRGFLEEGNYLRAVDAYQRALELAPDSVQARNGFEQATNLKQQAEAAKQAAAPARRFVESETEFTPGDAETEAVDGFKMDERFDVNDTSDPFFPAQIIIEINPPDAKPGEPYVLRVRVFNDGYRPIEIRSLELVSRFGDRIAGKGLQIPTRTRRIDPQATGMVHEVAGTWKEAQQRGEVVATVMLAGGGTFSKSISW